MNSSGGNSVFALAQFSNIPTGADPLDTGFAATSNPTSTTWTTGALTTSNATDLCVWAIGSTTQGAGASANTPYTLITPVQLVSQTEFMAYNNVNATGSQSASGNMNGSNSFAIVRGLCVHHN